MQKIVRLILRQLHNPGYIWLVFLYLRVGVLFGERTVYETAGAPDSYFGVPFPARSLSDGFGWRSGSPLRFRHSHRPALAAEESGIETTTSAPKGGIISVSKSQGRRPCATQNQHQEINATTSFPGKRRFWVAQRFTAAVQALTLRGFSRCGTSSITSAGPAEL